MIPVAVVLAIVAGRMSARHERLARFAIFAAMVAWVVGMTLAVTTENSLVYRVLGPRPLLQRKAMRVRDQEGLNAGYVAQLLEDYLDAPASVPAEWRKVFEENGETAVTVLPGLRRLIRTPVGPEPSTRAAARGCRPRPSHRSRSLPPRSGPRSDLVASRPSPCAAAAARSRPACRAA